MSGTEQSELGALELGPEMFRLMADHAPSMLWVADPAGRVAAFNRTWYEFTGRTPAQDEGDGWMELVHPDDREAVERQWEESVRRCEPCRSEYRLRRSDGQYRWLMDDGRPVLDERGRLKGFVGSCRDVTERRAAADELRASTAVLQEMAAAIPGVLYRYEMRADGTRRYTYVSEGVRELLGVEPEAVMADGMSIYNMVNPEQVPGMRREGAAALREGRASVHDVEVRLPDGRVRQVRIRASALAEREGARVWTGLIVDVSDEKRIAAALAKSEERAQLALETVADGLWDWNIQTGELYIAPKNLEMLGYGPEELQITHISQWRDLWHPDEREEIVERQRDHFEGRAPLYELERRLRHKRGHYVWVLARGRVVQRGPDGEPLRMVGTNLDMTARREQERALRESEERFRAAYEHAPVGVVIADLKSGIVRANPALCSITGYSEAELVGLGFAGITHPDDADVSRGPLEELRSGLVAKVQFEKRYVHKSGRTVWVLVCVSTFCDAAGEPSGHIGQILDITAQKRVLAEREETEARWHGVLESSLDCIITMDEHGRIVDFNRAAERTFGHSRVDVVGRAVADTLIPARLRGRHEHGLAGYMSARVGAMLDRRVEMPALRADGSEFPAELAVVPTPLPNGRMMFTAYLRDITARKSAEEALRASVQRFQTLGDLAPVGIFLSDAAGDATYVNPRWLEMAGMDAARAMGRGWLDAVHPEDRERVQREWYEGARKFQLHTGECRYVTPSGVVRWVYSTARPLRNEAGTISGYLGTVTDVTPLKEAESRVRQSLAQREDLLRREASLRRELDHRVRNNLAALLGLVGLYERSGRQDGSVSEALRGKLLAMREVHEVIARAPGSPVILARLIERLAAQMLTPDQARRIALVGPPVHLGAAQAGAVAMILQELLTNARKHGSMSAPDGTIRVEWERVPTAERIDLRLVWSESGGPPAAAPASFGVGLHLVQGFAAAEMRGGVEFGFGREGFSCILRAKLAGPPVAAELSVPASPTFVERTHEQPGL